MGEQYLTGLQLENWVREQTKEQKIKLPTPLEKLVITLEKKLPLHFTSAKGFFYQEFPYSDQWIASIKSGERLNIPEPTKEAFKAFILDRALATDTLLQIKNQSGEMVTIAVDVTGSPEQEREKLLKIRGQSSRGSTIFQGFPSARSELGIDKHCVILLNSNRDLLPSQEYLLNELYNFANSNTITRAINLTNVPELQRFDWSRPRKMSPQEMWQTFARPTSQSQVDIQVRLDAGVKALAAGYKKRAVIDMLQCAPVIQKLNSAQQERVFQYYESLANQAEAKLIEPIFFLLEKKGTSQPDGQKLIQTEQFTITGKGNDLQILRKEKKGNICILSVRNSEISNDLTAQELKLFIDAAKAVKQEVTLGQQRKQRGR
jgi:hypothetical protein